MKMSKFIKLLQYRKEQYGDVELVDDLGYVTIDAAYNNDDNTIMIVTDTWQKAQKGGTK